MEQEKVFVTPKTVPEIAGAISDTIGVAPPVSKPTVDMESIRRITTNIILHPAIGINTRATVGPIKAARNLILRKSFTFKIVITDRLKYFPNCCN